MSDLANSKIAEAVAKGYVDFLQQWLDAGGKPDECVHNGQYLVHFAAYAGSLSCLKLLVDSGASLMVKDESGYSPLYSATIGCRLETVTYLLDQRLDIDATSKQGMTALHCAVNWATDPSNPGSLEVGLIRYAIAQGLLAKGADPHIADNYGDMALHAAARTGEMSFIELLLEFGADPNAQNLERYGSLALSEAVMCGMKDAADRLIAAGAKIDLADSAGNTALHAAVHSTSADHAPQMVIYLLERGADPSVCNREGKTPEETIVDDPAISKVFAAYRSQKAIEAVLHGARTSRLQQA